MTSSKTLEGGNLSTLYPHLPELHSIGSAFQLSISSQCGKHLSLVCIPPEVVNKPDEFYSWVATRRFVDENHLPPETAPNIRLTVIGVLGDYATYDRLGKAVSKLTRYEDLFACLTTAKEKWSRLFVYVRPRDGLPPEKQPRKPIERKRKAHRHPGTQSSNSGGDDPPLAPSEPGGIAKRRRLHNPERIDNLAGNAGPRSPGPSPIPPAATQGPPLLMSPPERSPPLSTATSTASPTLSPVATTAAPMSGHIVPSPLPAASTAAAPSPPPAIADPVPPPATVADPGSPATIDSVRSPPRVQPPVRRSSTSPPLPPPVVLPFQLDDIPQRYHHFFLGDGISPDLYLLFPIGFPYGAPAADVSLLTLMCIFLMARQTGRRRILSFLLETHLTEHPGIFILSFLGTAINGVTLRLIAYQAPRSAAHKICSFGCGAINLVNKTAVLRHHRPRLFSPREKRQCTSFPGLWRCPSSTEFRGEGILQGDGGLQICYHEYTRHGTEHFKTQLLQVGQSLLAFASTDLRMSLDNCVARWSKEESGW